MRAWPRRGRCEPPHQSSGFSIIEFAFAISILGVIFLMTLKGAVAVSIMRGFVIAQQIQTYRSAVLNYQADFKVLPGDDPFGPERWNRADSFYRIGNSLVSFAGDGRINGYLSDPGNPLGEQYMAWRDLRLANYIDGDPTLEGQAAQPESPNGGLYGFAEDNLGLEQVLCLTKVLGREAEMIDKHFDDGNPRTGIVRGTSKWDPIDAHNHFTAPDTAPYDPEKTYIICLPYLP